jgi:hypothetical protein
MEDRMAFVVHLLGWSGPPPEGMRWACLHVRAQDVESLRGSLLLAGERALDIAEPVAVHRWLRRGRRRALLCLETCRTARLDGWLEGGLVELVPPRRLAQALEAAALDLELGHARWPREPSEWLPDPDMVPRAGTVADRILRELVGHRPLHAVRAWAAACSVPYRRFLVELRKATGGTPTELAQLFALGQAELADSEGVARHDTALLLDYETESTLAHALRRARAVRTRIATARAASTGEDGRGRARTGEHGRRRRPS